MMSLFLPITPVRLQVNPIECGAACLGIILDYYGYQNQQHELNELLGISRNGSDALSLVKGIRHFGLKAEAKRRSAWELKNTVKPSIVFFDSCHFVVLEGHRYKKYFINDPAKGRYSLGGADFRRRFSGIEIEIHGKAIDKKPLLCGEQLVFGSLGFSLGAFLSLLLMSLSSAFSLVHDSGFTSLSFSCALLIIFFAMWYCVQIFFLRNITTHEAHFQTDFMDKCARLSPSFFETRPFVRYQELLSSIDSAPMKIMSNYRSSLSGILIALWCAQCLVFWVFSLMLAGYIFLCGIFVAINIIQKTPTPKTPNLKDLVHHFLDMDAMGQKDSVIKEYLLKDYEVISSYFNENNRKNYWLNILLVISLLFFFTECFLGYFYLRSGAISHGALLASLSLFLAVSYGFWLLFQVRSHDSFRDALLQEMKSEPKPARAEAGIIASIRQGSFSYPGQEKPIFERLTLELKEATIYAIVGGPRSGKSTLQKILAQKLPLRGEFLLGGDEQNPIKCALIDEDAELFCGSLLENVRVYETSFLESDVTEALRLAVIDELFFNRPMGLLASIDQGGANLSGGQKKRLLLARALIHKPELLVLDNFFDSLDDACAQQVLENLKTLQSTTVFSSFRSHELAMADQVIFIDNGHAQMAPHSVWMSQNQSYRALVSEPLVRHYDANKG